MLKDVLPNPYLSHYSMLVAALSLLSSDIVTLSDIDAAAEYLRQFYQKFHDLYGKLIKLMFITYNFYAMGPLTTQTLCAS